jgi:hypothetical protein
MNYFGYRKKVYIPKSAPDTKIFNDTEIYLVKDIIEFVCYNNTAKTISELSHNRAWEIAEFGNLEQRFLITPPIVYFPRSFRRKRSSELSMR